jgi:hypothetical protein
LGRLTGTYLGGNADMLTLRACLNNHGYTIKPVCAA